MGLFWVVFDRFLKYPVVLRVNHQNDMLKYTVDAAPRGVLWKNRQPLFPSTFLPLLPCAIDKRDRNEGNQRV